MLISRTSRPSFSSRMIVAFLGILNIHKLPVFSAHLLTYKFLDQKRGELTYFYVKYSSLRGRLRDTAGGKSASVGMKVEFVVERLNYSIYLHGVCIGLLETFRRPPCTRYHPPCFARSSFAQSNVAVAETESNKIQQQRGWSAKRRRRELEGVGWKKKWGRARF